MATCVYCGAAGARSKDHIPPRGIYSTDNPPPGAPWVRACGTCNGGFSKDDEYFRDTVLKHHVVSDLPAAQSQIDRMLRAMGNPKKLGYVVATLRAFTEVDVRSADGQVVGRQHALNVNNRRFGRVAERIARGLRMWKGEAPSPADALVAVHWTDKDIETVWPKIEEFFSFELIHTVQPGVFSYALKSAVDHPESFIAVLIFFDVFPIVVVVRRAEA